VQISKNTPSSGCFGSETAAVCTNTKHARYHHTAFPRERGIFHPRRDKMLAEETERKTLAIGLG